MVIKCFYIFYHVLCEQKFPVNSDFQEFQGILIKKPHQELRMAISRVKPDIKRKKYVHGRKLKVLIKFFEKILLESSIHIQYLMFSPFHHTCIKII